MKRKRIGEVEKGREFSFGFNKRLQSFFEWPPIWLKGSNLPVDNQSLHCIALLVAPGAVLRVR
jgi:hypothetical protein